MTVRYIAMRGPALRYPDKLHAELSTDSIEYEADAIILIMDGQIVEFGPANKLKDLIPKDTPIESFDHCRLIKTSVIQSAA